MSDEPEDQRWLWEAQVAARESTLAKIDIGWSRWLQRLVRLHHFSVFFSGGTNGFQLFNLLPALGEKRLIMND
jgi:hypothetical protein